MITTGSDGDMQQPTEVGARGSHVEVERPRRGRIPRLNMSSVNDVIVSSCAIFSARSTNVLLP